MVVEERIIEEEQSVKPEYDSNYDYTVEEDTGPTDFQATGNTDSIGFATFFDLKNFVAGGLNSTFSTANLNLVIAYSGQGLGEGTGSISLVGYISYTADGINETITSANVSNPIDASASGLAEGIGNATQFEYITALVADALGIGDGTSDITVDSKSQDELDKREESFFIGDVEIPLLVSKDVSVERETVVKEFVRDEPQFFQESSDFESGSYSAFLNQENHSEGKTLEEQIQDVRKLIERQPEQNKIDYADGKAYAVVNSVGDVIDVNEEIKEVEIELIILENL